MISEYIKSLQDVLDKHGDLEINKSDLYGNRTENINWPSIEYKKILGKRERVNKFWCSFQKESSKGEKVCRI